MMRFGTEGRGNKKSSQYYVVIICLFAPYFGPGFHFMKGMLDNESFSGDRVYTSLSSGMVGTQ